jgi:hypothetical protein
VAERYYRAEHFVWCAPVFDARSPYAKEWHLPPTSSPSEIYRGLMEEVKRRDRHSAKIAQNKIGIIRGASVKRAEGIITKAQEKEIVAVVNAAETADFAPLINWCRGSLKWYQLQSEPTHFLWNSLFNDCRVDVSML